MQSCHALSVDNTNIYLIRLINGIFVATVDLFNPKTIFISEKKIYYTQFTHNKNDRNTANVHYNFIKVKSNHEMADI